VFFRQPVGLKHDKPPRYSAATVPLNCRSVTRECEHTDE
jgi:hypothetical protein